MLAKPSTVFLVLLFAVTIAFSGCAQPETQIFLNGSQNLKVVITPVSGHSAKGTLQILVNSLPNHVAVLRVMLSPAGLDEGLDASKQPNVLIKTVNATIGAAVALDTTKVKNGVYDLTVGARTEPAPMEYEWEDEVQTQLSVEN